MEVVKASMEVLEVYMEALEAYRDASVEVRTTSMEASTASMQDYIYFHEKNTLLLETGSYLSRTVAGWRNNTQGRKVQRHDTRRGNNVLQCLPYVSDQSLQVFGYRTLSRN